jgi:hypothetical protein
VHPRIPLQIIQMVTDTYDLYPSAMINRMWLTLQSCMNMIIEHGGGNDYKIPHLGKQKLDHQNLLSSTLKVTPVALDYLEVTEY